MANQLHANDGTCIVIHGYKTGQLYYELRSPYDNELYSSERKLKFHSGAQDDEHI